MSGVEVMQELNRIHGKTFKAVAPFILTTPIVVEKGNKEVVSRDWMFQEKFFSERVPHTACVNECDQSGPQRHRVCIARHLRWGLLSRGHGRDVQDVLLGSRCDLLRQPVILA